MTYINLSQEGRGDCQDTNPSTLITSPSKRAKLSCPVTNCGDISKDAEEDFSEGVESATLKIIDMQKQFFITNSHSIQTAFKEPKSQKKLPSIVEKVEQDNKSSAEKEDEHWQSLE